MISRIKTIRAMVLEDKARFAQYCALALICLGAFLYAVYHVEIMGKYSTQYTPDEGNYIEMARRMLNGGPYGYWGDTPDAYVSPGLPVFLVALMALFGSGLKGIYCIQLVQCVQLSATVFLLICLACSSRGGAGWAFWQACFSPLTASPIYTYFGY